MGGRAEDGVAPRAGQGPIDPVAGAAPPESAEAALAQQLAVAKCVAGLVRRLLPLPSDGIEAGIRTHLSTAAELAGADRTRLVVLHPDGSAPPIGHYDWCAAGVAPDLPDDAGDPGRFRWALGRLSRGEPIRLSSIDELPAEAIAEREDLTARGVCSLLALPVFANGKVVGFQSFECVGRRHGWTDDEIATLSFVGEIFAGAARRSFDARALCESDTRFRAIAEHATELVAEFDVRGCYRYTSPSFERRLGYPSGGLVGHRVQELMHIDDFESLRGVYAEAIRNESEVRAVHRLRHQNGDWRWFESSGRAIRMADGEVRLFCIGRDVTERRAVEEAIERQLDLEKRIAGLSREFLALRTAEIDEAIRKALVEAAALAGADRCFLHASEAEGSEPRARYEWRGEGVTASQGEPCPWFEREIEAGKILNFHSIDELPREAESERRNLQQRGVKSLLAIPIRSGDVTVAVLGFEATRSEQSWFDHDITLLRLIGEILASALGRKYAEGALRESESMLLQSQKLEAVGRLAGGIAHDFNNLLTVILGFSRPLLRELPEGDPVREDVQEIYAAAERAASLTRQLLTFSRRQAVDEQVVDLNAMLSGLETLLERLLREDVEVAMELCSDLAVVKGDTHQFEQVVINLVVNARDAMPDGGTLKIATRNQSLDGPHARRIGLSGAGRYVVLSVLDSGQGMDEDTRAHIFDPFFTTKEPGKGTGLGLSIVYSVVEQASGAIHVEGGSSKGTTFEIWLPAAGESVAEECEADGDSDELGIGCVLLVEDEPALRRLARRVLEGVGYRVLEAGDGAEALEMAAAFEDPIHALVADVVMPRLGGLELAQRLRRERPEIGILFMSGYPDGSAHADMPPGSVLIEKPFRSNVFLARLRDALGAKTGDGGTR